MAICESLSGKPCPYPLVSKPQAKDVVLSNLETALRFCKDLIRHVGPELSAKLAAGDDDAAAELCSRLITGILLDGVSMEDSIAGWLNTEVPCVNTTDSLVARWKAILRFGAQHGSTLQSKF